jgi:hypothetical protein
LTGVPVAKTWRCGGQAKEVAPASGLMIMNAPALMGGGRIDGKECSIPVGLRLL